VQVGEMGDGDTKESGDEMDEDSDDDSTVY